MSGTLEIKVIAGAAVQKWVLDPSGTLKCYVKSPAQAGRANKELCSLIAQLLGVPGRDIVIIRGVTSPRKIVKIPSTINQGDFITLLGLSSQKK